LSTRFARVAGRKRSQDKTSPVLFIFSVSTRHLQNLPDLLALPKQPGQTGVAHA
jgi:hypothetical protein